MMRPDLLTELFETLRLESLLSFVATLGPDSAVAVPAEPRIVRFHLVRTGSCEIEVPGETPRTLDRGDLVLVSRGARQVLRARGAGAVEPVPLASPLDARTGFEGTLGADAGPAAASLLCGYCRFDPALEHPILEALPALLVLRDGEPGTDPSASAALRLLGLEATRGGPGSGAILTRVIEIVLVQAVRSMIERREEVADVRAGEDGLGTRVAPADTGFLAALGCRQIGGALAAIHREPGTRWTLTTLAREAGMSRAGFADAFARRVGLPPIAYLTSWRMMLARDLLRRDDLAVDRIAERVGYASVPAFSRRFKTAYGIGPGAFRRRG